MLNTLEQTGKILESVGIPALPAVILEVKDEIDSPKTDFDKIVHLVKNDVSLAGTLMNIANSHIFGDGRVDAVDKALMFLGVNAFYNILMASSFKQVFGAIVPDTDNFYNHSQEVANTCASIAKQQKVISSDVAYITGLFHDCGIPLLMKKFPDYAAIAASAMGIVSADSLSGKEKSIIGIENEKFETNHCVAGYLITTSWHLPESITNAILYHHYIKMDIHEDLATKTLSALLLFSEFVSKSNDYFDKGAYQNLDEWAGHHKKILEILDVTILP
ncbi:MAG: HDOD domain-containing protein [Nitrospirae bacterium]|nr:HDOD domain-containing protein [Nitrospirota bacterium]